jgi:hypothetical protein
LADLSLSATGTAPAGAITGDLAQTLAALTLSSVGTVEVRSALAKTLAQVATSATAGTVEVRGTLSAQLAALVASAAGAVEVRGALASTLAAVSPSAAGGVEVRGTSAATLGGLGLAADGIAGEAPIEGTLSATLGTATLAATGTVAVPLEAPGSARRTGKRVQVGPKRRNRLTEGALFARLEGVSVQATATTETRGAVVATLGNAECIARGRTSINAGLKSTLVSLTASGSGRVAHPLRAALARTLDGVTTQAHGFAQRSVVARRREEEQLFGLVEEEAA